MCNVQEVSSDQEDVPQACVGTAVHPDLTKLPAFAAGVELGEAVRTAAVNNEAEARSTPDNCKALLLKLRCFFAVSIVYNCFSPSVARYGKLACVVKHSKENTYSSLPFALLSTIPYP